MGKWSEINKCKSRSRTCQRPCTSTFWGFQENVEVYSPYYSKAVGFREPLIGHVWRREKKWITCDVTESSRAEERQPAPVSSSFHQVAHLFTLITNLRQAQLEIRRSQNANHHLSQRKNQLLSIFFNAFGVILEPTVWCSLECGFRDFVRSNECLSFTFDINSKVSNAGGACGLRKSSTSLFLSWQLTFLGDHGSSWSIQCLSLYSIAKW